MMDNRTSMLLFLVLVVLFAFTFVFGIDALALPNVTYGILSLIGYIVCLGFSIFQWALLKKERGAMMPWFITYAVVIGILFVWYLSGNIFMNFPFGTSCTCLGVHFNNSIRPVVCNSIYNFFNRSV